MKTIFKTLDHRVPNPRAKAGKTKTIKKSTRRARGPYDAVAFAAALEVLG